MDEMQEQKRRGSRIDSLLDRDSLSRLELEPHGKFDLTHVRTALEAGDLSVVSALAVDAVVGSVVCTKSVNGMVKYVEGVHEELCSELLGDRERLRERHIRVE